MKAVHPQQVTVLPMETGVPKLDKGADGRGPSLQQQGRKSPRSKEGVKGRSLPQRTVLASGPAATYPTEPTGQQRALRAGDTGATRAEATHLKSRGTPHRQRASQG